MVSQLQCDISTRGQLSEPSETCHKQPVHVAAILRRENYVFEFSSASVTLLDVFCLVSCQELLPVLLFLITSESFKGVEKKDMWCLKHRKTSCETLWTSSRSRLNEYVAQLGMPLVQSMLSRPQLPLLWVGMNLYLSQPNADRGNAHRTLSWEAVALALYFCTAIMNSYIVFFFFFVNVQCMMFCLFLAIKTSLE